MDLERVSLTLLVLLSPHKRINLDKVLLILLFESLKLGFFLVELDLLQAEGLLDLVLCGLSLGELVDVGLELFLKLLFLIDHLLNVVVGADGQRGTALDNLGQMGDLSPQVLNDAPCTFFLLLSSFDQFPSAINLFLEQGDGR